MAKPIIDPATLAKIRGELLAAQSGNFMDQIVALQHAIALVLAALEA